jgi:SAM-dependent methyltransferase
MSATAIPIQCPLCRSATTFFGRWNLRKYFRCGQCLGVFLHPDHLPSPEKEKERYDQHQDPGTTKGYLKFVDPLLQELNKEEFTGKTILDFGAGPHSFLSRHLTEKGWDCTSFDPFFYPEKQWNAKLFDAILLVEVMEHFHHPHAEFGQLKALLKPGAKLLCMTSLFREETDFSKWYYKNDPTHVFFYHEQSIAWISKEFGFKRYSINGSLIVFKV